MNAMHKPLMIETRKTANAIARKRAAADSRAAALLGELLVAVCGGRWAEARIHATSIRGTLA